MCRRPVRLDEVLELPPPPAEPEPEEPTQQQQGGGAADGSAGGSGGGGSSSAKIAALLVRLKDARARGRALPAGSPPIKAVVFSQFVGMLQRVKAALQQAGIPYVSLDGSSSAKSRAASIRAFACKEAGSPEVFLVKGGGGRRGGGGGGVFLMAWVRRYSAAGGVQLECVFSHAAAATPGHCGAL